MIRPLCIAGALLALAGCAGGPREPSPNVGILKNEAYAWHGSGGYAQAFTRSAEDAMAELERYLRRETPQNFAVVFDIDETLLSNWPYLSATQFALAPDTFAAWVRRERGIALEPMRAVYARALAYQIPIFLVTGRPETLRADTQRNLQSAGYWGWKGLFMRPVAYRDASIVPFKSGVRRQLTEQGYEIILNVGDQESDLEGGYARRHVKLPNPFYYIP